MNARWWDSLPSSAEYRWRWQHRGLTIKEEVLRFEVAVVDAVVVAELQRREHLAEVCACNVVAEGTCRREWGGRVTTCARGEPGAAGSSRERQGEV